MDEQVFYVRDKSGIWIGYGSQTDVRRAKHFWLGMGIETKEQMYSTYKFFFVEDIVLCYRIERQ